MAEAMESPAPSIDPPYLEFRPLLRALGIASDAKKLILATVGLAVFYAGCFAFAPAARGTNSEISVGLPDLILEGPRLDSMASPTEAVGRVAEPFRTISGGFASLFRRGMGLADWLRTALLAVWAAVVWGITGGAIARIAVVQAAIDGKIGLGTALGFAMRKAGALIGAPLIPTLAVAILAVGCALFGLLYRIPAGIGGIIVSMFGFVPLLLGLLMALVLVGLALGWPLMHATIAAEGEDAPDALSRSYSYINQRLGRYAAHVAASLAIGSIGLMAVNLFAAVVVGLAEWGVSLGSQDLASEGELTSSGRMFWERAVGVVVLAWVYSYFWSAASIIYLILRRDVDGTAWHDVYLPEHEADAFVGGASKAADPEFKGEPIKDSGPGETAAP